MAKDEGRIVHAEFRIEERACSDDGALADVRRSLRSTWAVPTDTFITSDIPLLLTRLSLRASPAADDEPDG